jgi:hypothetical protein
VSKIRRRERDTWIDAEKEKERDDDEVRYNREWKKKKENIEIR